jgi:hypothetical protein
MLGCYIRIGLCIEIELECTDANFDSYCKTLPNVSFRQMTRVIIKSFIPFGEIDMVLGWIRAGGDQKNCMICWARYV